MLHLSRQSRPVSGPGIGMGSTCSTQSKTKDRMQAAIGGRRPAISTLRPLRPSAPSGPSAHGHIGKGFPRSVIQSSVDWFNLNHRNHLLKFGLGILMQDQNDDSRRRTQDTFPKSINFRICLNFMIKKFRKEQFRLKRGIQRIGTSCSPLASTAERSPTQRLQLSKMFRARSQRKWRATRRRVA